MFLHFLHTSYSFSEILEKKWATQTHHTHDPLELDVLEFCFEWLRGTQSFTLHTSGSTGTPKAITLLRKQLEASVQMTAEALPLSKNLKALVCLNTAYIGGKMMLTRGLELNWELFVVPPQANPLEEFYTKKYDFYFDFMAFVPLQLENILEQVTQKPILKHFLNTPKAIIVGGAGVSESLKKQIQTIESPVFLTYGMTETVSHIALQRLNGINKSDFFKTLPQVHIHTNTQNCLEISSPTTNFQIITTNDVVELIDNETFKLIGRADNIINSGGVKIQLEKIEKTLDHVLSELKISVRFYAFGQIDPHLGQKLVVYFEASSPFDESVESEIKERLKSRLSRYEIPKLFLYAAHFQETDSGKVKRLAL